MNNQLENSWQKRFDEAEIVAQKQISELTKSHADVINLEKEKNLLQQDKI